MRIATLIVFLILPAARADSLDTVELKELRAYLAELELGRPGSAAAVERLAPVAFPAFLEIVQAYAGLKGTIEPHTHRAFQNLLERTSREALSPWPMVTLYSPPFARFLTRPTADGQTLFRQLLESGNERLAFDLCVRLTPTASLEHLAAGKTERRIELFEAWNRRLARGRETRPLPDLDRRLEAIARGFSLELGADELEARLAFLGSWPVVQAAYEDGLRRCLGHGSIAVVEAALVAQQRAPLLLNLNVDLIEKWKDHPKVVELALRNFAFDETGDHSATLRRLWTRLPADQTKARYQCLFAMGVHPKNNEEVALAAVREQSFDLFDVAMPILRRGDPSKAREAVKHVLAKGERGHEEALRLARDLKLAGFEEDALKIALDGERDQILRQTAMLYLEKAEGKFRRKLLPSLALPKGDLRLTAIRAFKERKGLDKEDLRAIGPALIRVALTDPSMGHRQEAMYALGCWKAEQTMEFFRKLLCDNPAVVLSEGYYSDVRYWQYRFRLMGLLGMAKLNDGKAKSELLELHARGSPAEKMDVLLAFLDLGEVPEAAWADLDSIEPRLVATAARLIADHGDAAARERLKKRFASSPLWQQFRGSGIDDYNILRIAEGKER